MPTLTAPAAGGKAQVDGSEPVAEQVVGTEGAARATRNRRPPEPVRRGGAAGPRPADAPAEAEASPGDGGFLGRERELDALRADIDRTGLDTLAGRKAARGRVLLIAGRPGSGRTSLAEALVRRLRGDYPDGLLRARLTTSGGVPVPAARPARDFLAAVGVTAPPGAREDELSELLRKALAGRRMILLLDDAGSAEQVDALLPDAPDCLVVAVSRGPLTGIPDVRPCTLGGLPEAAGVELLSRRAGSTRITNDPQAAEAVVRLCDAQPAALVLAGGWLAARPKASVADLARRLRAQPAGAEDQGARPLARAFRLVHEELPEPAARMLRLLALAPDGTVDAVTASALAGCSVPIAQGALEDFTALGLLTALPRPERAGNGAAAGGRDPVAAPHAVGPAREPSADSVARHRVPGCLEPLLRAELERERSGEVELARARMLERTVRLLYACRLAARPGDRAAREKLAGLPRALRFPSPQAAEGWLTERLPELLEGARLAVADGELDTLARRLLSGLTQALAAHRGTEAAAPELYGLHQLVLDVARRRELELEEAAALLNLGDLDARAGRTREALVRYKEALEAARVVGDPYATGRSLESIGSTYQELGDWHRAADWYGRALALRLSRGELADEARLYGRLGAVRTYAGQWGEALRAWRAAAAVCRRLGDLPGHARALSETARVQEYAGRPHEALRTCLEAIEAARRAEDVRLQAAVRLRAADSLERLGDPGAARLHRGAAERLLAAAGEDGDAAGAGPASGAVGTPGGAVADPEAAAGQAEPTTSRGEAPAGRGAGGSGRPKGGAVERSGAARAVAGEPGAEGENEPTYEISSGTAKD
ncbi:tetratricopeptide repeat protein [Streptomyces sp. LX-29]|uniref:tetratricopeptide repeat protein n=1 Tax=Streptomyces sp. LX-29 TaxID=2900152 RepID=UPI00240DD160|nr:tetratricopeptide repeat protein [Streptomyces sp. LX-29]WFB10258.1 tetratricopeptide repeat protein [Streptomyces sp. LX-29]